MDRSHAVEGACESGGDSRHTRSATELGDLTLGGIYVGFHDWAYSPGTATTPSSTRDEDHVRRRRLVRHEDLRRRRRQVRSRVGDDEARSRRHRDAHPRAAGTARGPRSLSAVLGRALFLGVEVKDCYYYEFSLGRLRDATRSGALAAVALSTVAAARRAVRLPRPVLPEPAVPPRSDPDSPCSMRVTAAELPRSTSPRTTRARPTCSRSTSARSTRCATCRTATGRGSSTSSPGSTARHYKPPPTLRPDRRAHQQLFLGVSLNAQGLFD